MASKFGGLPVESQSKFGGIPTEGTQAGNFPEVPVLGEELPTKAQELNPVLAGVGEFAAGANNAVVELVDFLGPDQINNILQLSGSETRVPTLGEQDIIKSATVGGFVDEGLGRDILRTAGSMATAGGIAGQTLRQGAQQLPTLVSGAESMGAGILRQLGSSRPAIDVGAGAVAGAGSEFGGEVGEAVAGPEGRAAGELVGSLVAPLTIPEKLGGVGALTAGLRRLIRPDAKKVASTVEDFSVIGSTPTVGQATGRSGFQGTENLSGSLPGGGPISKTAQGVQANIQKRLRIMADTASTKEGLDIAGRNLQKGITGQGGFIDRFQAKSSDLWRGVDDLIPLDTPVSMTNVKKAVDDLTLQGEFGAILNNPKIAQIKGVLDGSGSLKFEELKLLRSAVGRELSGTDLAPDIPRAQLKKIYGALSDDVRVVAEGAGPEAVKAWSKANNHTRAGHKRLDGYVKRIAQKGDLQKVYESVIRGTEDVATINAFKRSLNPEEWNVVASNALRQMGKSTPGQQSAEGDAFSVAKFLTDWNRLGPKARKAIFSGTPELNLYSKDMNKIARIAESVKESARVSANPSGTSQALVNTGTGVAAATAAASGNTSLLSSIVGTVALNNGAARLMTSPRFVNWLSRTPSDPAKLQAHIAGLEAVASKSNVEDAMVIYDLIGELESASR